MHSSFPTPRPFSVKIESPPPSDPTGGLDNLSTSTAKLAEQLDRLERRNREVDKNAEIKYGRK